MNPKELLSKEISCKVGDKISERTISEKVSQFFRHGNVFLLFEVMSLRISVKNDRKHLDSVFLINKILQRLMRHELP